VLALEWHNNSSCNKKKKKTKAQSDENNTKEKKKTRRTSVLVHLDGGRVAFQANNFSYKFFMPNADLKTM
jgi:hypothetical protein